MDDDVGSRSDLQLSMCAAEVPSQSVTPIYPVSKLSKTHYLHFVDLSLQESLALALQLRAENKLGRDWEG